MKQSLIDGYDPRDPEEVRAARARATRPMLPPVQPEPKPTRWDWLFALVDDPEDDFECRRLRRQSACLTVLGALLFGLATFFGILAFS